MKIIDTLPTVPIICIYGAEGLGKSSFGKSCPAPFFVRTQNRHSHLNVKASEVCRTTQEIKDCFTWLYKEKHDFKTVILDTFDWAQPLLQLTVASRYGVTDISDPKAAKALGYGKGYEMVSELWQTEILRPLEVLRDRRGIMPVILGASRIVQVEDGEGNMYPRWDLDLQKNSASKVKQFCDVIGYLELRTSSDQKQNRIGDTISVMQSNGKRILRLQPRPQFIAKAMGPMPDFIEMPEVGGWSALEQYLVAPTETPSLSEKDLEGGKPNE